MKSIKYKLSAAVVLVLWAFFVAFILYDNLFLTSDLNAVETLEQSSLARGMFMDIGMISTVIAGWIIFYTKSKWRWIFGILTVFVGSTAALPYIAYHLWSESKA